MLSGTAVAIAIAIAIAIRHATPDDAPVAARIIAAALAEHALPFEPGPSGRDADVASFGARADHDDFVALVEGRAVGVVGVGPHGDAGVAWISKLFVAREARRRGVGAALLERAHEAARARGFVRVGLRSRLVFRDALALYERAGYRAGEPSERGDVVLYRAL